MWIKRYTALWSVLCFTFASRPDIMLSVCMCAIFQSTPKESHHMAVKRILRYFVYTPNLGLWYPNGSSFKLVRYSDSDWAGDKVDRKYTSGSCQFLSELVLQEAKLCFSINRRSRVYCRGKLLCSIIMDEANFDGLWCQIWQSASIMWQWKCNQDCG